MTGVTGNPEDIYRARHGPQERRGLGSRFKDEGQARPGLEEVRLGPTEVGHSGQKETRTGKAVQVCSGSAMKSNSTLITSKCFVVHS